MGASLRIRSILHYIVAVGEVPDTKTLTHETNRLIESIGFKYFGIFSRPKPIEDTSELIISANWPREWVERYVAKKYIVWDPLVRYLLRTYCSFSWTTAIDAYRASSQFRRMKSMLADMRSHGLEAGYVFPVFSRTGLVGATSIGGTEEVELSPSEIALLETAFRNAFFKYLEFTEVSHGISLAPGADISITLREMQALNNLAEGRTSPEIASILDVSANTVDWYVNSLQTKLKARNRNHAVAIAFRQGLIS